MNKIILRFPRLIAGLTWLISLSVALAAFGLAEFGGPRLVFVLFGVWLCSLGLPTTISIVALAFIWGDIPFVGTPSLAAFIIAAAVVSFAVQMMAVRAAIQLVFRRSK